MTASTVQPEKNALEQAAKPARDEERSELLARGWAALPASYRIPEVAPTLDEARAWCKRLAESHYENFHVATWFLPKALRPHFHSIYAYCRVSDDLGDEVGSTAPALALLEQWGRELDACYEGRARHPVFVALSETIRACSIPKQPFADLLTAFRQDQTVTRYASMDEVLGYCRYSANPVGRLVLYACGEGPGTKRNFVSPMRPAPRCNWPISGRMCAWIIAKGRVYIPQDEMRRFGVSDETIAGGVATPEFRALLRHEVDYARSLFEQGLPLIGMVNRDLALDLDLFSRGGLEILRAIERRDYDVLSARPAISKRTKLALALRAVGGKALPFLRLGTGSRGRRLDARIPIRRTHARQGLRRLPRQLPGAKPRTSTTRSSLCPQPRRNAICAIYAFMRQADDLADDESFPCDGAPQRTWTHGWRAWREVCGGAPQPTPFFSPCATPPTRYAIPLSLLDELVAGVTMDLDRAEAGAPDTYATFADLYRYCYLVASVVGLVCIHIFGYRTLAPRNSPRRPASLFS